MKILLTAINSKYIHSNLAVYALKAYALKKGLPENVEIEIAEYTINQQFDHILMDIYERRPDVLCLSCYIWNLSYVERVAEEMKKLRRDMPVWIGGPEVSYDSVDVLKRLPQVAGVMKGEGEETFAVLVRLYGAGQAEDERLSEVEGITFRTQSGEIKENLWRSPMNLSEVPFVYEDMTEFEHKIIYYETSRGCPFSCSYCLSSVDKKLRFRDLSLVKKELQFFLDHKVPQVKFVDRTFNCNHQHAMEVWSYISEHDNGITNFHFEVSADLLREEELQLMEKMRPGLIQLEIGVQSVNPETIREIKRTMDLEKLKCTVAKVRSFGNIHQHLDLIAGLPFENMESFSRSFDEVYRMYPQQLQLGFLKVLKGSYMEEKKGDYGLVYQSRPPYEVLYTRWLSYEEILRLKGIEEMVEVYYNSRQFEQTIEALEKEFDSPFAMYEELWDYYKEKGLHDLQHKRSARYEILLDFISGQCQEKQEYFRELLIYDYYLRENAKTRPQFAGEIKHSKETVRNFYVTEEKERKYLNGYEKYDKNQMRKMTHLETFLVLGKTVLFDYQQRNPLNGEARTWIVSEISENYNNVCCKKAAKSIKYGIAKRGIEHGF